jgi:hypothetical protein
MRKSQNPYSFSLKFQRKHGRLFFVNTLYIFIFDFNVLTRIIVPTHIISSQNFRENNADIKYIRYLFFNFDFVIFKTVNNNKIMILIFKTVNSQNPH